MKLSTVLTTVAATVASAGLGGVGTDPQSDYYLGLRKPSWQPPPAAFGLVWTPLYADIAITSAHALDRLADQGRSAERQALRNALIVNLALNTGWSWLFFKARQPWLATAECAVLAVSSADLARRIGRADRRAGVALSPYPLWCGFATALSLAIARLNPRT